MINIKFGEIMESPLPQEKQPRMQQSSRRFVGERTLFSLYVVSDGVREIENHLKKTPKVESGGLLLGHAFVDIDNPEKKFTVIIGSVPVISANSSIGHYAVSPEELIKARLKIPEGLMSVGWYHSHPGHGIFLSGADMAIMKHIYNLDWQVAFVFDTFSGDRGFFHGEKGIRIRDINYLNQKPIIIEAIIRYNCAVAAKEDGDESIMESFKNWICKNPNSEMSHWIQSGMYQDVQIDKSLFLSTDNFDWKKEFHKAVSYYNAGQIYSALLLFEQLSDIKKDAEVSKYLMKIRDMKRIY